MLVSEMNFGASSRWTKAGDTLPSELLERPEPPAQSTMVDSQQVAHQTSDEPSHSRTFTQSQDSINGSVDSPRIDQDQAENVES